MKAPSGFNSPALSSYTRHGLDKCLRFYRADANAKAGDIRERIVVMLPDLSSRCMAFIMGCVRI